MVKAGGNAEFAVVDERIVGFKPKSIGYGEAAALPLTTLTAYEGMFDRMKLSMDPEENKGKTMLIINAAGGVGSIAIQLAKMIGLTVIGTAVEEENIKWVKELGADYTISHFEPFLPQLEKLAVGMVDYAMNFHSHPGNWEPMLDAVKPQGEVCMIALGTPVEFSKMGFKSISVHWELMFTRSIFKTKDMQRQHDILNHVAKLIDEGKLRHTASISLSPITVDNMRKAHTQIESGHTYGKVVVSGDFENNKKENK
jgi:zinc-binding alcohol dehydrogenase family protein